jgi:hypothetical protein
VAIVSAGPPGFQTREVSGHHEDKQSTGDYETASEQNPIVGDPLEENERDYLRHQEKGCGIDALKRSNSTPLCFNHETVRE